MTVSSTNRKAGPFTGNGVATSFPFTFKIFDKTNVSVLRIDSNGNTTTLALDSDFSVAVSADQNNTPGGTVTYPITGAALPAGYQLVVLGNLPNDQETDITNSGGFYPKVIEDMVDRATIQIQQIAETVSRAIVFNPGENPTPALPTPNARANTVLGFDALGSLTEFSMPASVGAGDLRLDLFTNGVDFTAGVTTSLLLSRAPINTANVLVFFDVAAQFDFKLSGSTLQFIDPTDPTGNTPQAIPAGISKVYVRTGTSLSVGISADGSVTDAKVANNAAIAASKLAAQQMWAGAVTRSVLSKLADAVDVRDFGADPTGTLSSVAAFNAALAVSRTIRGEGTFLIDGIVGNLTDTAGWQFFGSGPERTKFLIKGTTSGFQQSGDGSCVVHAAMIPVGVVTAAIKTGTGTQNSGSVWSRNHFLSTDSLNYFVDDIEANNVWYCVFERNYSKGPGGTISNFVKATASVNNAFVSNHCIFKNIGVWWTNTVGPLGNHCEGWMIANNCIAACAFGFQADAGLAPQLMGNIIDIISNTGINSVAVDTVVIGNWISSNGPCIFGGDAAIVIGNRFNDQVGGTTIAATIVANYGIFANNQITGFAQALTANSGNEWVITGNSFINQTIRAVDLSLLTNAKYSGNHDKSSPGANLFNASTDRDRATYAVTLTETFTAGTSQTFDVPIPAGLFTRIPLAQISVGDGSTPLVCWQQYSNSSLTNVHVFCQHPAGTSFSGTFRFTLTATAQ